MNLLRATRTACMGFLRREVGRPRLIIHEYAVTFSGRGFGRVAEVAETQVLEARLACHRNFGPGKNGPRTKIFNENAPCGVLHFV